MTRNSRHQYLPLTYEPKMPGVLAGTIDQSIRMYTSLNVGDFVAFHGWSGTPYRSGWSFRTPFMKIYQATPITIFQKAVNIFFESGRMNLKLGDPELDAIAGFDGINPATGVELIRVLRSMHGKGTLHGKILRWDPAPLKPQREKTPERILDEIKYCPGPDPDQTYNNHNPIMTIEESPFIQIGDIQKQCRDNPAILQ